MGYLGTKNQLLNAFCRTQTHHVNGRPRTFLKHIVKELSNLSRLQVLSAEVGYWRSEVLESPWVVELQERLQDVENLYSVSNSCWQRFGRQVSLQSHSHLAFCVAQVLVSLQQL